MTTIVVTPIEFEGSEIELHGEDYHHLFWVKRLQAGESVRVVDGEGRARRGVVARVDRARGVVALGSAEAAREPSLRVELLVAPPKLERAAWLVEKATELGVAAIRFVASDRSARDERAFGHAQLARLHRVAIAAIEQCGRAVVPEVTGSTPLADQLAACGEHAVPAVVLDPAGGLAPFAEVLEAEGAGRRLAVVVGPEGGWSSEESALFERLRLPRWSLGDRVLRVETAAIAAAAIVLAGGFDSAPRRVDTPGGRG